MKSSLKKKLQSYSLMAGSLLATSSNINAQAWHTDVDPDITIVGWTPGGDTIHLDVNNDSIVDFLITIESNYNSIYDLQRAIHIAPLGNNALIADTIPRNMVTSSATWTSQTIGIQTLKPADTIRASDNWNYAPLPIVTSARSQDTNGVKQTYAGLMGVNPNVFIGLLIDVSGQTHFGWVRLRVAAPGTAAWRVTLKDYAFELTANNPLATGDMCIIPPADPVTGLRVSMLAPHTVRLHWDTLWGVHHYRIKGRRVGAADWKETTVPAAYPMFYDVGDLENETDYEWRVRAYYDAAEMMASTWANLDTFTTGCQPPDTLWADTITANSVRLAWTPAVDANKYQINARVAGTQEWHKIFVAATNTSKVVRDLQPNTPYQWMIRTICDNTGNKKSAWSPIQNLVTTALKTGAPETASSSAPPIRLSPNPARSQINISLPNDINTGLLHIILRDIAGKQINLPNINRSEASISIDVRTLPSGMYYLILSGATLHFSEKIIIP